MTSFLIIGLGCWLAIVVVVLGILRVAARADAADERRAREAGLRLPEPEASGLPSEPRRRHLAVAEAASVALVVVLAARSSEASAWSPVALTGMLAALAIAGDLQTFRARRFRISASFP